MALDKATTAFIAQMSQTRGKALHEMTPEEARQFGPQMRALYGEGPAMGRVEAVRVESGNASFDLKVLVPDERCAGVIVYYHGGGWVVGHIDDFETLGRKLAARSRCAVVLVNYRLAPEHRFPAAVDDAYEALLWAHENRRAIAGGRVPLIVAGDSAGGNLAAVVARRARDEGGPAIALQALIYPVTDADMNVASYTDPANQLLLSRESMVWFWDHYVPDIGQRSHPDASPLRAESLAGLPPALVLTAEHDPLRDEGEAYAARLVSDGVPVRFRRYPGQMHGFFTMVNVLPASEAAINEVATAIREELVTPRG